jgi:LDH2 family malate/lactate/ureidoglycolate dehydrogenase
MSATRTLAPEALRHWIRQVLVVRGLPGEEAALVAEALVDTSLRGVDTHGIGLLPGYAGLLENGVTKPRPVVAIERHGAFLKVDADRGLGQVVVGRVLDRAIDMARELGCVTAAIGQVGHLGALGWFARRAADRGMISLILQNGPPLMGLPGSTARAIGNNPVAYGVPVVGRPPVVFDVATSEAAYGKLLSAAAKGEPIPEGWALDKAGDPTLDPHAAMEGILLPSGGAKGIGLAMLVEALAGSLTGTRADRNIFGAFLMVIDPAVGDAGFGNHVAGWLDHYAASAPDARYPGQRAETIHRQRSRDGIPVSGDLGARFAEVAERTGVPLPEEIR